MLIHDLRTACRALLTRPVATSAAVLTLAIGLGANTAMFSVVQAVLIAPLPYAEPDRLARIVGLDRKTGARGNLSPADFMDFAAATRTFERMGAHGWIGFFTVSDAAGEPERVGGVNVTEGFFPTLGAPFVLGRAFSAEEDRPNGPRVAILGYDFWQRRFGGDGEIVGRTITVNTRPATVVGVLGPRFRHVETNPERSADVFMPYQFETAAPNRGGHFIRAVGRVRPEVSIAEARAELVAIAADLERRYPRDNTDQTVAVDGLHEAVVAEARPALLMLAAAVIFVLAVACANLANLTFAQSARRGTEIAIRAAMGASRTRLLRQLVTESLVLATAGAIAGVVLAMLGMRALTLLKDAGIPRPDDIALDWRVLLFTVVATMITGLLTGLAPALESTGGDVHSAVREGGRGHSARPVRRRARELLIASQIGLALVLLIGSALMLRSLWELRHVRPGFVTDNVLSFEVAVPTATYPEGEQVGFYERLFERISGLPGVQSVGGVNILPLTGNYDSRGIQIESDPRPESDAPSVQARSVSSRYFEAMGIPLLRGRTFTSADREGSPRVVIVSALMAARFWPGRDPVGQRLTFNSGVPREQQQDVGGAGSREVIGVVGDVKHLRLGEPEEPMFYTPQAQQPSYHTMSIVVRAGGDAAALTSAIRREIAAIDRTIPLYRARMLDSVVDLSVAAPRLRAWLLGLFAAMALVVAVVGVYGVVSYLVSQRTQEIGVRLALGAERSRVLSWMLLEGLRPVALGLVSGLALALPLTRLLEGLLYGVSANDVTTYAAVAVLLLTAAIVAIVLPARRATRIDPAIALRAE